ncbi:MAG: single-stranded-DNA-specific exonuclease RecJ [Alphaproteobacteria bacterium]|nr:single-stranded-DNA-specific exonuclease RecJ [Alphaproteobacteria bacterium]
MAILYPSSFAGAQDTLLRVDSSFKGARWVMPEIDGNEVRTLVQTHNISELIARVVLSRNIPTDNLDAYFAPKLSRDFPDPLKLKDMQEWSEYMAEAIRKGKRVGVFADFDVDGSCSAALIKKFFQHIGRDIPVYIPDRLNEGYGPNKQALTKLKDMGCDIVLMADCGTSAHDVIAHGQWLGMDICIFDHHEPEDKLPGARFLVNPKRADDTSGYEALCAAGVVFLALVALNSELRAQRYFDWLGRGEPPLKSWLDLVALATVCDMVPMQGPNRLLTKAGFEQMAHMKNNGIRALAQIAKLEKAPTQMDAGFALGPRINAGSRVHRSDLGAKLLSAESYDEALQIAYILEDCNLKRRDMQKLMMEEAVGRVTAKGFDNDPVIIVDGDSWHPGLAGLIAGGLKEKYDRPACVITYADVEGGREGRGSGRSIKNVNIASSFMAAKDLGLLVKGGGHAMAGGFTIKPDKIDEFRNFMIAHVSDQMTNAPTQPETMVDGIMAVSGITPDSIRMVNDGMGPFGVGHTEPVFVIPYARVLQADIVGKTHVSCRIADQNGGGWLKGISFRSYPSPMGEALLNEKERPFHLLGQVRINHWQGRDYPEFQILDAAYAI